MEPEKNITSLVGAYLPQPLVDYLNLYAFACDRSKSELLRDAFEKWYEIRQAALPMGVLVENISAKLQQEWVMHCLDELKDCDERTRVGKFSKFKEKKTEELEKRLAPYIVEEILDNVTL